MTEERRNLVEAVEKLEEACAFFHNAFTEAKKERMVKAKALRAYDAMHSEEVEG